MKTTYKASAAISKYKNSVQFYPVVKFWGPVVSDSYYINTPQPTRAKALTIARNAIKTINE